MVKIFICHLLESIFSVVVLFLLFGVDAHSLLDIGMISVGLDGLYCKYYSKGR